MSQITFHTCLIFGTPKINLSYSSLYDSILLQVPVLPFCNLQKPRLQSSPVISRPHPHRCSPCLHLFSSSIPNDCKTLATFFSFQQNKMSNLYNSIKINNFTQFVTKTWDCHKDSCASGSHFALSEFSECRASQSFHPRCRPCHLKLEASLFCHHEDWSHIFASTFQLQNHKHSNIPNTQNFQLPTRFPISTSMEPRSHNYSRCLAVPYTKSFGTKNQGFLMLKVKIKVKKCKI